MIFHYFENGIRKYTLKSEIKKKEVFQSHPAKFSPLDKFSKYRIQTKIKYKIYPFND